MKKIIALLMIMFVLCGCGSKGKYTVGVIQLVQHDALDAATQGFVDELTNEFGDDIVIDVQNASGDSATCLTMATSFVSNGYDLIMANATPALQAAAHATSSIPVLGTSVTEYGVALDLKDFNGVVGGNVSGTSDLAPLDDQAQMILDLFPNTKKVGIIYCSAEANSLYQVNIVKEYLEKKNIEVVTASFLDSNEVSSVADSICQEIDALYIPTDNTCASNGGMISSAAIKYDVPIIAGEKGICENCECVATFTIDYYELGKTTGAMAAKILKGESDISTMPIEYYASPMKLYNKERAEHFGVTIPSDYKLLED